MFRITTFVATFLLLSGSIILLAAQTPPPPTPPSPAPPSAGGQTCSKIIQEMTPCLSFVRGKDADPSERCCEGAKELNDQVKSKEDRQTTCDCLKQAIGAVDDADPQRISQLPQKCGIQVSLPPIDRNIDCSKDLQNKLCLGMIMYWSSNIS
ncbi:hypothetical protein UlMin_021692 [Ulmus minor]